MTAKGFLCLAMLVLVMGCETSSPQGAGVTSVETDSEAADKDSAAQVGADSGAADVLDQAWALYDQKKFQEAYDLLLPYASEPTATKNELCSAGTFADRAKLPQESAAFFARCDEVAPNDFNTLVLLIRAYEIAGDTAGRDAAYPRLVAAFEALPEAERNLEDNYRIPRDRFEVDGKLVRVEEFLQRVGKGLIPLYIFHVSELETDTEIYSLVFFFEEFVTELKRGKGEISATDEVFALDYYDGSGNYQALVDFYLNEPTYDFLKTNIIEYVREH